ncbi:MAG: tetratricopeptide repeat protein [Blastocatellia bacterium]|nr:tetratricopeptide repeat protein [Blastocatellia bacterium]
MSKNINNQIQLKQVEVHSINDNESRVEVELCLNERSELVEKTTATDLSSQLMTIGLATLECIKLLLSRPLECQINYVKQISGKQNTRDSIETLVRVRENGKEILLNGSSLITDSIYKATVLSLLNALARLLEKMTELQQQRERVGRTGALVIPNLINVGTVSINDANENTLSNSKNVNDLSMDEESTTDKLANVIQAKELFIQAEALIRKGNYTVAKQTLKEAISLDNTQANYHCQLGISLANLGENEEAEKLLLKATEIDPNSAICQTELGLFYKEIGRIDKAQILLEKAVELGADARAKRALATVKELICVFDPEKEKFLQEKQELKTITGSLKTKNNQDPSLFSKAINTKTIAIFFTAILVLISASIGIVYLYNYLVITTRNQISDADLENPRYKAIKIVSDFPSTKKGLSVGEQIEQYIKEQNIKEYTWVAAPDKTGQYIVVVTFNKNGKEETAIWTVDLTKKICKAESGLAKQFSGS